VDENVAEQKLILVVDDQKAMVMTTRLFLESQGYRVVEAYDGMQALDRLLEEKPDLIILDVMMPRLDGWGTLQNMRVDERFCDIPVIMLTALNDPKSVTKGFDLGATWYYEKPITDFMDFGLIIDRVLQGVEPPASDIQSW